MNDSLVIKAFLKSWGAADTYNFFPGPQPVSIERKHFGVLRNNAYVVCEKTDGIRYALFCKIINGTKVVALINRALRVKHVSLVGVPKKAYLGTIVDGELVDDKFIVYDGIEIYGQDIKKMDLECRLTHINRFVTGTIRQPKTDSFEVSLKVFSPLHSIKSYIDNVVPNLKHKTDGFIFTPVMSPVRIGTHETMFKWKPRDKNTIDFKFKKSPSGKTWILYIQEKGMPFVEAEIDCDQVELPDIKEDDIVECQYMQTEYPMRWKPIHIRTDKMHPNNRRTYFNTLLNISENIQFQEFFNL
jgi:mRNA guanylyltransferase